MITELVDNMQLYIYIYIDVSTKHIKKGGRGYYYCEQSKLQPWISPASMTVHSLLTSFCLWRPALTQKRVVPAYFYKHEMLTSIIKAIIHLTDRNERTYDYVLLCDLRYQCY